ERAPELQSAERVLGAFQESGEEHEPATAPRLLLPGRLLERGDVRLDALLHAANVSGAEHLHNGEEEQQPEDERREEVAAGRVEEELRERRRARRSAGVPRDEGRACRLGASLLDDEPDVRTRAGSGLVRELPSARELVDHIVRDADE